METVLAGHYQIVRHLGGGGFGQTFLAQDRHLPGHPFCVVKQFKPQVNEPSILQTAKRLFDQEAETLYRLNGHDQIPRLLAHFEQEQEFYLVQEFVEGQPLNEVLHSGEPLDEASVIDLLRDTLQVLEFVHRQNVIHRDIKPANLIRRHKDHKIVLIDFGAVKEVSSRAISVHEQSNLTIAVGSPGYMPSEQILGNPHFSSDIYAVGMLCIQALTGLSPKVLPKDPLTGELTCALLGDRLSISPALSAILDRMVRYDYRQRYEHASAALNDLQQLTAQAFSSVNTGLTVAQASTILMPSQTSVELQSPSTSLEFEEPEGQVSLASAFYVERPPTEMDCYERVAKPGALIRIKAPRQMGKTSLMSRVLYHAGRQGYQTASLNFQSADAEFLTNLDQLLQWFCASITYELDREDKLADYWKGILGSKNKCTNYFQRYLLSASPGPIALGLDEVDQIFQHPEVAADFFGLLRAWHERAKNEAIWQKLRLIIVHSKEVYIPLNINQSPFNVGLAVELPELTTAQVENLVHRHGLDWTEAETDELMTILGGHPYLVRKALYQIARGRSTLPELLKIAPTDEGIYGDHLRRHLANLEEDANLVAAIKQVVAARAPVRLETSLASKLRSMGLVKFQGNDVVPLCGLYCQYFRDRLGVS